MKTLAICTLVLCVSVFAYFAGSATAHVLQADSEIGAIIHFEPDDNPITGRKVEYVLSFEDTTNRFSLFNCDCLVNYVLDGKIVATRPLVSSFDKDSLNSFTFDEPGTYILEVSGKPKPGAEFQDFALEFSARVSSGNLETQSVPLLLLLGIGGAISLIILAAYVTESSSLDGKIN